MAQAVLVLARPQVLRAQVQVLVLLVLAPVPASVVERQLSRR